MKDGERNFYIEGGVAAFCLSSFLMFEKWKLRAEKSNNFLIKIFPSLFSGVFSIARNACLSVCVTILEKSYTNFY